jgi:hypothetical protein
LAVWGTVIALRDGAANLSRAVRSKAAFRLRSGRRFARWEETRLSVGSCCIDIPRHRPAAASPA